MPTVYRSSVPDVESLRLRIFESFASTGAPPTEIDDREGLEALAAEHVVVLDERDEIVMAHPFAAHRDGARVEADGRTWWGSCAWDALGIVAALRLRDAVVTDASGISVRVRDGVPIDDALFHVLVPARHWWEDVGFT